MRGVHPETNNMAKGETMAIRCEVLICSCGRVLRGDEWCEARLISQVALFPEGETELVCMEIIEKLCPECEEANRNIARLAQQIAPPEEHFVALTETASA